MPHIPLRCLTSWRPFVRFGPPISCRFSFSWLLVTTSQFYVPSTLQETHARGLLNDSKSASIWPNAAHLPRLPPADLEHLEEAADRVFAASWSDENRSARIWDRFGSRLSDSDDDFAISRQPNLRIPILNLCMG